ncbi:MAG: hypothetical protein LLG00_11140 [Planctomycetaceae bacterium]|nr:hypothetical protein [Planctomycetaceae bacterium]
MFVPAWGTFLLLEAVRDRGNDLRPYTEVHVSQHKYSEAIVEDSDQPLLIPEQVPDLAVRLVKLSSARDSPLEVV